MVFFRKFVVFAGFVGVALCFFACKAQAPKIVHIEFCDFLHEVHALGGGDTSHSQEKQIHYIIDNSDPGCCKDTVMKQFIGRDAFIQSEIRHGYYSLSVFFYRKSENTAALMKSGSSKNLDYCNDDIIAEYMYDEGKFAGAHFYDHGQIKGSEEIKLIPVK